MKIGINATILDDKPTGLGIFTLNIIKKLANKINDKDKLIVYTSVPEYFENVNVEIREVPKSLQPKYGKKAGLMRFIWSQIIFPFRVHQDKCDLIYSTTHHGNLMMTKKQILTIHDLLPIKFPNQYRLQNLYFKTVVPHLIKRSPFLLTVSNNTKNDIVNYYHYNSDKIGIVYNSYEKKHFNHKTETDFKRRFGDYLLFLGASYPHKNVERAIKSFLTYIDKSDKKVKLLIVNKKNEYLDSVIEKFKNKPNFSEYVIFLDYVDFNELPIVYSNAEALLYPSLYEGFGIPPLEAMACGCPVIASNNSSIPEVCGDNAVYIDPYDENSIFQGIKKTLENDLLRNKLSVNGYKQVLKFDWSMSAERLYEYLKKEV